MKFLACFKILGMIYWVDLINDDQSIMLDANN